MFAKSWALPFCFLGIVLIYGTMRTHAGTPAEEMRKAATAWMAASDELKSKALLPLDGAERESWNYVPMARKGAAVAEMSEKQRELLHDLLRSALSQRGFLQATTIVSLELVLREMEQNDGRDPGRYFLTIFGEPTAQGAWGWRFEGHHLSLNFALVGGAEVTVTPSFLGSNPADSSDRGKRSRPLASEEDLARDLVRSLDAEQRRVAIFSETAPREIISGNQRKVTALEPAGISYSRLNPEQQQRLRELVGVYVNRYRAELAREDLGRIEQAGWTKVSFAWAGGLDKGQGHYYRVQGPHFLMEYDNTQNRANHIHTVWRDLDRDFGGDLLREHYRTSRHHDEKPTTKENES